MTLVKRNKTVNPAAGINPLMQPNVGQFGWTSADTAHVNQLISYVKIAKEAAESAANSAEYVKNRLIEIDKTIVYFESLFQQMKPIADRMFEMYNHIIEMRDKIDIQYEHVVEMDAQIKAMYLEIKDILEEMKAIRDETNVYKDSAKNSEIKSKEYMDASFAIYEELKKGQVYRGTWNPNTGAYPDPKGTNSVWDVVLNAGQDKVSYDGKDWFFGDRLLWIQEESKFEQLEAGTNVKSVNGKTGAVVLSATDVGAFPKTGGIVDGGVTVKGDLVQDKSGYGVRMTGSGSTGFVQAGKMDGSASDQKMAFSGINGSALTEAVFKIKEGVSPQVQWSSGTFNIYHSGDKPTAGDVGAVARRGDTMSGDLVLEKNLVLTGQLTNPKFTNANKQILNGGATQVYLGNRDGITELHLQTNNGVAFVNQGQTNHRIYHQGFKPNAGDVGALPASGGSISGALSVKNDFSKEVGQGQYLVSNLGTLAHGRPSLVLIAPVAKTGDKVASRGFVGRILVHRGSVTEGPMIAQYADVVVKSGSESTVTRITDQYTNTGSSNKMKIVATTYEGAEWVGVFIPTANARWISIEGVIYGSKPILIADASSTVVVDRVTEQDLMRVGDSVKTINVTGAGASEGYQYMNKVMVGGGSSGDSWIRVNPYGHFTTGIYTGTVGSLRHDGHSISLKNWDSAPDRPVKLAQPVDEAVSHANPGEAALNVKHRGTSGMTRLINSYDDTGKVRSSISVRSDSGGSLHFQTNSSTADANRVSIFSGNVFTYGSQSGDSNALTKKSYVDSRVDTKVSKSGDTMTGDLTARRFMATHSAGFQTGPNSTDKSWAELKSESGITMLFKNNGYEGSVKASEFVGIDKDSRVMFRQDKGTGDKKYTDHLIYHTGKKPTADELRVISKDSSSVVGNLDFNTYTFNGKYNLLCGRPGDVVTNGPTGFNGYGTLEVIGRGDVSLFYVTQTVVDKGSRKIWVRTRNDTGFAWTDWTAMYTEANPPKVDDIDAVKRTGDTMTGVLTVPYGNGIRTGVQDTYTHYTSISSESGYSMMWRRNGSTTKADEFIGITNSSNLQFRRDRGQGDRSYNDWTIYHTGYKPSAADVGAPVLDSGTKAILLQSPTNTIKPGAIRTVLDGSDQVSWMTDKPLDESYKALGIHSNRGPVVWDGALRDIYHTGRKPSAADTGALPLNGGGTITGGLKISRSASQLELIESDNDDKAWVAEVNNKEFRIVEAGQAIRLTMAPGGGAAFSGELKNAGGEIKSKATQSYRMSDGVIGTFWRKDGTNLYLMRTEDGKAETGGYSTHRPFAMELATGQIFMGNGLRVSGDLHMASKLRLFNQYIIGNNDQVLIRDHGNGTVTFSGGKSESGVVGDLVLGFNGTAAGIGDYSTRDVRFESPLNVNGKDINKVNLINSIDGLNLIRRGGDKGVVVGNINGAITFDVAKDMPLQIRQGGGGPTGTVYTTLNKPTAADVDAVPYSRLPAGSSYAHLAGKIATIGTDGVMEVCRYIDMHVSGSTKDFDMRIECNADNMNIAGGELRVGGKTVYTAGTLPSISSQGGVLKTGDTMTGNLRLEQASVFPYVDLPGAASTTKQGLSLSNLSSKPADGSYPSSYASILTVNAASMDRQFQLCSNNDANEFHIRASHTTATDPSGWHSWKRIYHTGYKPTAADVGARPADWVPSLDQLKAMRYDIYGGDLDALASSGMYSVRTGATNIPPGAAGNGDHLISQYWDSGAGYQIYTCYATGTNGKMFLRNKSGGKFQAWRQVYDSSNKPTKDDVGLSNVPNTVHSATSTGGTVALRDSSGDLTARLLRAEYSDESGMSGAIAFRKSNSGDNFTRYCSNPTAVRSWLDAVGFAANVVQTSGWDNVINRIPRVSTSGVMDIGKYIDFHNVGSVADYSTRLYVKDDNTLTASGGFSSYYYGISREAPAKKRGKRAVIAPVSSPVEKLMGINTEAATRSTKARLDLSSVATAFPEGAVVADGATTVDMESMIALLVETCKDLTRQVQELKAAQQK